ncbi:MAG: cell division protein FtsA [Pseudomonadota bacterium]
MSGKGTRLDLSPLKPLSAGRTSVISVIDIGTEKICCVIAKLKPRQRDGAGDQNTHDVRILGIGYHRSAGIKAGVVMDMEAAEHAIRRTIDSAEKMAGVTVESVIINASCGRISSETFSADVTVGNRDVRAADVQKVLRAGREFSLEDGRTVLHSLPIGYTLDGNRGVSDPIGMIGDSLAVDMNIVTADAAPVRNLILCVERCHVFVDAVVASPYVGALGALTADEMNIGSACIDIGAGTTSMSVFFNRSFVYADTIAIGGHHVTMDLARGLSTSIQHAERIKALYGSVYSGDSDDNETVNVPRVGSVEDEDVIPVPRSSINAIIRPRVEEILELMRDRLKESGALGLTGRRLVLTGGASLQTGMVPLAERILECRARIGRPQQIEGLPETAHAPPFAAVMGLTLYPQIAGIEHFEDDSTAGLVAASGGYLSRVGQWLKESF